MASFLQKTLFGSGMIPIYGKLADLSSLRHKLIASNVANVNTEGYQRKEFDFDSELKRAIDKPKVSVPTVHPHHIPIGDHPQRTPKIESVKSTPNSTGVNSVDIDQEMADLAQNQLIFEFGADMLSRKFKALRNAIKGGQG